MSSKPLNHTRKRSLSVAIERAAQSDEISKKLEAAVSADHDNSSESEEEENGELMDIAGWTSDDYDQLTAKLRTIAPAKDVKNYRNRLLAIDWEQVAFGSHSAKEVESITKALLQKARNFRTLAEVVEDIPSLRVKIIKAGQPKKPCSAYNFFFKDKYAFFKNKYQGTDTNLLKKISEEFSALTDKKKQKYEQMAEEAKETYKAELEKYYQENPHVKKIQEQSGRKGDKTHISKILTPFKMFTKEKRSEGGEESLAELRAMWEELEKKQRYKYIQQCFQQQSTDKPLKLTKEEQSMVEYASGKPEPVPHNVYDFYLKKYTTPPRSMQMSIWRREKISEYKSLPKMRKLELELEHRRMKLEFVQKYQEYISNLPDETIRRTEIEMLQSFIANKMDREEKRQYNQDMLNSMVDCTSTTICDEVPIAESTTHDITSQPRQPKKSKATNAVPTVESPTIAGAATPATSANVNGKQVKSILKSPPLTPITEPPSKRKQNESASSPAASSRKRQKKQSEIESDTNLGKVDKKSTIANAKAKMQEPVRPPKSLEKYYEKYHYLGKPGKSMESYEKLSALRKRAIKVEMDDAKQKYFRDVQRFLKQLPKENLEFYLKKLQLAEDEFNEDSDATDQETADGSPRSSTLAKRDVHTKQELQSSSSSEEDNSDDEGDEDVGAKKANAETSNNKPTNDDSSSYNDSSSDNE